MNGLEQAPHNEQLYVKGTFNGWGDDTPMAYIGEGRYQAVVCLSADQHSFKISDQQGSEDLTFSADKYKAVSCFVDQPQALIAAKGIGNDLTFSAPETGIYTISLVVTAGGNAMQISLGGENHDAEPNRNLIQADFSVTSVSGTLQANANLYWHQKYCSNSLRLKQTAVYRLCLVTMSMVILKGSPTVLWLPASTAINKVGI